MQLYASIWRDYSESGLWFYETAEVTESVSLGTQLHGGFSACSFILGGVRDKNQRRLRVYLGAHVVIFDVYSRRIWEGRITNTSLSEGGVGITAAGYYADASNVFFDMIYPAFEATENLVKNPSFEVNVTDSWTFSGGADGSVARDIDYKSVGSYGCAVLQPSDDDEELLYYATIPVSAETQYTLSLDARKLNVQIAPFMFIKELPSETATDVKLSNLSDESWINFPLTITTKEDTTSVEVGIRIAGTPDRGYFIIDAVQFEQKPYATPYADGSLGALYSWTGVAHNSTTLRSAYSPTIYEIIHDCIDMVPSWNPLYAQVSQSDYLTGSQDFTNVKVGEAVESVMKYGYREDDIRPLYFALWDHRIPRLFPEPTPSSFPDWFVSVSSVLGGKPSVAMDLQSVFNRVYAVYDDQGYGQSKTLAAEDYFSQQRYGVIEGLVQNGGNAEGIALAEDLRDMALTKFKDARQVLSLELGGFIRHSSGHLDYPYRIRAGQQILIVDMDAVTAHAGTVAGQVAHGLSGFVLRTEYSGSSHSVRVDLGVPDASFDVLMSRLGLSGGLG